jgi:hypothetical protein
MSRNFQPNLSRNLYFSQAERLSHPPQQLEINRTLPKEQPLGIPIYNPQMIGTSNKRVQQSKYQQQKEAKYHQKEPILAPMNEAIIAAAPKRIRMEPTYPLPPRSQFPLGKIGIRVGLIQGTGRSEFEDGLGSCDFVSGYSYRMSVRNGLPDQIPKPLGWVKVCPLHLVYSRYLCSGIRKSEQNI